MLHAVLVGCVMFFCGLKPYEAIAGYVALDPHPKAELCSVDRVVKNILIFRPSPNQQSRVIIANQVDVADGDKRWVHALARSYKTVEDLRIRFIVEIERFKRPLSQFQNVMADFGDVVYSHRLNARARLHVYPFHPCRPGCDSEYPKASDFT